MATPFASPYRLGLAFAYHACFLSGVEKARQMVDLHHVIRTSSMILLRQLVLAD